jgi:predicted SprT family Zn-dependent metalloprotease
LPENAHKNKIDLYFNLAHTQKIITRDHTTAEIRFMYRIYTTGMAYFCKVPVKITPKKVNIKNTVFIILA